MTIQYIQKMKNQSITHSILSGQTMTIHQQRQQTHNIHLHQSHKRQLISNRNQSINRILSSSKQLTKTTMMTYHIKRSPRSKRHPHQQRNHRPINPHQKEITVPRSKRTDRPMRIIIIKEHPRSKRTQLFPRSKRMITTPRSKRQLQIKRLRSKKHQLAAQ